MEELNWQIASKTNESPIIVSEYLLNDLGLFVKRERRVQKSNKFYKLTGFRVGYQAIPGTDYYAAPFERQALLWKKVAFVEEDELGNLLVKGNKAQTITVMVEPSDRQRVSNFIADQRSLNPLVPGPDFDAASWICWQEDDDWGDPFAPLKEMVDLELQTERFLEQETVDKTLIDETLVKAWEEVTDKHKFCSSCGAKLDLDSNFCSECGSKVI